MKRLLYFTGWAITLPVRLLNMITSYYKKGISGPFFTVLLFYFIRMILFYSKHPPNNGIASFINQFLLYLLTDFVLIIITCVVFIPSAMIVSYILEPLTKFFTGVNKKWYTGFISPDENRAASGKKDNASYNNRESYEELTIEYFISREQGQSHYFSKIINE